MLNLQSVAPDSLGLEEVVAEAKKMAREQMDAASTEWRRQTDHILEERIADLTSKIESHFQDRFEQRLAAARTSVRREIGEKINQAVRRLRNFENEEQWSNALLDAATGFCGRAALFLVTREAIELRGARGFESQPQFKVALDSAPAFRSAVDSRDTVVALRTPGELGEPVAQLAGPAIGRCTLFPLGLRDRVAAVLYADSADGNIDTAVLETLAGFGALVLEGLKQAGARKPGQSLQIIGTLTSTTMLAPSPKRQDQDLHLRAQRCARVRVAEIRLYKSAQVKTGRAGGNLYEQLKPDIDQGREAFRKDFFSVSDSMVDYFHLEMLRTLANDNENALGPEYPGPLS